MNPSIPPEKTVLVTGASSGIGRAAAVRFAMEGYRVALVARNKKDLQQTARLIEKTNRPSLVIPTDVTKESDSRKAVQTTVRQFGRLDCLVNSAGIIGSGTLEKTSLADWDAIIRVNLRSVFYLMQLCVPHLEKTKGSIITLSSIAGLRSFANLIAYCTSKAGVDQLTRCAALELGPRGIRVNAVNPGVVRTNLHRRGGMNEEEYQKFTEHSLSTHPLGRIGDPEEVAELILFLASERSGWITGVTLSIDGGRALTCAR